MRLSIQRTLIALNLSTLAACSGGAVSAPGNPTRSDTASTTGNSTTGNSTTGSAGGQGTAATGATSGAGGTQSTGAGGGNGTGGSIDADAATSDVVVPRGPIAVKLDLPARIEWNSGVGFCGEASIQTIALYYGAWLSQAKIRTIAGAPIVFGTGSESVLTTLHFHFETWDFLGATNPQFQDFMVWTKSYLVRGIPTIFATYVADHDHVDPDYDHLMPAIGVKAAAADSVSFDPNDTLVFNNNVTDTAAVERKFGTLAGIVGCKITSDTGGCIPTDVDYGVAVTGIIDDGGATVPVRVSVTKGFEPDVTSGKSPVQMTASVTASGLKIGTKYSLLRYNDYTKVPTTGAPAAFLGSSFDAKIDFTASGDHWKYDDPQSFSSDGAVFYRCVPN
jgi:hypothetical protein